MLDRYKIVLDTVESELARPYKPCTADCMYMGIKVYDNINGTKLKKLLVGAYKTIEGSKKEMVKRGYKSLTDVLADHMPKKAPSLLQMGDLAIVMKSGVEHVAVCCGAHFIVKGEEGREIYLLHHVISGFEV